jgi:hypothetical protein
MLIKHALQIHPDDVHISIHLIFGAIPAFDNPYNLK